MYVSFRYPFLSGGMKRSNLCYAMFARDLDVLLIIAQSFSILIGAHKLRILDNVSAAVGLDRVFRSQLDGAVERRQSTKRLAFWKGNRRAARSICQCCT